MDKEIKFDPKFLETAQRLNVVDGKIILNKDNKEDVEWNEVNK